MTVSVLLAYAIVGHHPQLTKQQVIDAMVTKHDQLNNRYAVKLVLESDLEKADPESGHVQGPDFYLWAVAVSGDCLTLGESGPPLTWSVALVKDQRPVQLSGMICGASGNWPPFFDQLIDRS